MSHVTSSTSGSSLLLVHGVYVCYAQHLQEQHLSCFQLVLVLLALHLIMHTRQHIRTVSHASGTPGLQHVQQDTEQQ